jgi:hypothetical protein
VSSGRLDHSFVGLITGEFMKSSTFKKAASRTRLRRSLVLGAVCTLAAGLSLFAATTASANLSGSTFEGNDGNLVVDTAGNTDWANVGGLHTGTDLPSGSNDNAFGQGTKEDNPATSIVDGSIPPNKNDLTKFYEASEQASGGDIFLYLGWERLVNIGSANLDFEINKDANATFTASSVGPLLITRTAGDMLVTYDFSGSGSPTLGLLRWLTAAAGNTTGQCFSANSLPCWGNRVNLTAAGFAEGAINSSTGLFGEAAINLTAAHVFQSGVCTAFGSTFLKSRSSSSFSAEIKDFIAPQAVNISNCGSITIHKVTENDPGAETFGYGSTGGLSPATFSLTNGGQNAYTNVNSGSYSVTENLTAAQTTAGWTLKSLSCTSTGAGTSTSVTGSTVDITEGLGGVVNCTYTNHINNKPTIATTLSKTTANIGDAVHDSSTLSGATATAAGTVMYHAYAGANTCTGTDLLNSQKTVANGVVPDSADFTPAAAGNYSFQAVYSGDANNDPATSVCSTEQLLVKTNPSISTTLSSSTVNVGATMHDSATLSGATGDAGGTVTYHAYAGANTCTGTDLLNSTRTVTNGGVPNSADFTPTTAGTYSFQAVYSGDAKNNGATSVCSTEQLVVNKLQPSVSTAQNLIPNDTFTLSGATSGAGGTITFNLYSPSDATCSGTPAFTQTVNVSGNANYVTTNGAFHASTEGTWRWMSTYSGDTNNLPVTSSCGTERFSIANS